MKYGMNLLLWTSGVTEEHFPLLSSLKEWGFDGVELPMFDLDVSQYAKIGAELKKTGLESTAVTVCSVPNTIRFLRMRQFEPPHSPA